MGGGGGVGCGFVAFGGCDGLLYEFEGSRGLRIQTLG